RSQVLVRCMRKPPGAGGDSQGRLLRKIGLRYDARASGPGAQTERRGEAGPVRLRPGGGPAPAAVLAAAPSCCPVGWSAAGGARTRARADGAWPGRGRGSGRSRRPRWPGVQMVRVVKAPSPEVVEFPVGGPAEAVTQGQVGPLAPDDQGPDLQRL